MELGAYHILTTPSLQKVLQSLRARVQGKINETKVMYDERCLVSSKPKLSRVLKCRFKCPDECSATFKYGRYIGHGHYGDVRVCFLQKLFETFDTAGAEAALKLVNQRDQYGRKFDVSHYCRVPTTQICLNNSHFGLESWLDNARRSTHQRGNEVCDCADIGLPPCMVNGVIAEKVFDDKGNHVGWKKLYGTKA